MTQSIRALLWWHLFKLWFFVTVHIYFLGLDVLPWKLCFVLGQWLQIFVQTGNEVTWHILLPLLTCLDVRRGNWGNRRCRWRYFLECIICLWLRCYCHLFDIVFLAHALRTCLTWKVVLIQLRDNLLVSISLLSLLTRVL